MLKGKKVELRPFLQSDIEPFVQKVNTLEAKGEYLPLNIANSVELQKKFSENGLLAEDSGRFLIIERESGKSVGYVVFFRGNHYTPGFEVGYVIYNQADRGKGYCSESLQLLTSWLFLSKEINRLWACMDTENIGSRRVAERCGYLLEGVLRGSTFGRGEYRDLFMMALTRADFKK